MIGSHLPLTNKNQASAYNIRKNERYMSCLTILKTPNVMSLWTDQGRFSANQSPV